MKTAFLHRMYPLVMTLALLVTGPVQAAPQTEVFTLGYNMADSLIPAIKPMLGEDERVSAFGNQLIVRAEPERIEEIRALLADIDRQPAQLRISVVNSGSSTSSERGFGVDGRFSTGAGDIIVGDPGVTNQARIIRRETRGRNDGVRQITANEGYPVLIQSGKSVPLTTTTTDAYGRILQQTQYQDVTQGFYATVRLNGDQATITLSANNNRLNSDDDRVIDVQQADTVVTGRVGEWITVGTLGDTARSNNQDIGQRLRTRNENEGSIRLMVERL
ncbi:secretin N-terminal domain-containing protein [Halopseudomonas sp.]|uniref:secretin N-terminal domain-containing protein n=1 Tax=Halopseudomonas sp. TaxID=2901191 RepID=UPI003566930E